MPIARTMNGSPRTVSSTSRAPGTPLTVVRGDTRMSSIAIASAPALRSSLRRSSTAAASISPLIRDLSPRPGDRVEALPRPDPGEVALSWLIDVVPLRPASSERVELALEVRDLRPELVVLGVQVGDKGRQVLGRLAASAVSPAWPRSWTTIEEAEDRGDAASGSWLRGAHRGSRHAPARGPLGTAAGGGRPPGDGPRLAEVEEPAKPGMSTAAGSAKEMPIPNQPRRVRMNSAQPCDRTRLGEQVRRPDRRDLVRGGEVRGVDEDRPADVEDGRR